MYAKCLLPLFKHIPTNSTQLNLLYIRRTNEIFPPFLLEKTTQIERNQKDTHLV
ncbi:hypothetical protein PGT21_004569 [Puccinia graminis f. sp. tritici]|uniref:Uncharacterized protein n=1 Tax=Puccinia graminis f. sp. tritici TaxID=56615 RepID=A0A5B0P705_PUCGR|nr:hypothetical protein PGT21_004569 [Puccinia graminis f. sp. tritici]